MDTCPTTCLHYTIVHLLLTYMIHSCCLHPLVVLYSFILPSLSLLTLCPINVCRILPTHPIPHEWWCCISNPCLWQWFHHIPHVVVRVDRVDCNEHISHIIADLIRIEIFHRCCKRNIASVHACWNASITHNPLYCFSPGLQSLATDNCSRASTTPTIAIISILSCPYRCRSLSLYVLFVIVLSSLSMIVVTFLSFIFIQCVVTITIWCIINSVVAMFPPMQYSVSPRSSVCPVRSHMHHGRLSLSCNYSIRTHSSHYNLNNNHTAQLQYACADDPLYIPHTRSSSEETKGGKDERPDGAEVGLDNRHSDRIYGWVWMDIPE